MVYRLRPLEMTIDFDDRAYKLGDTIDVSVELAASADVDVREVRVDLIRVEEYVQTASTFIPDTYSEATMAGSTISGQQGHVSKGRSETYVQGRASFLKDTRLRSGAPKQHRIALRIEPTPPKHLKEAIAEMRNASASWSFKWRLVAVADVVRGRNPRRQRAVRVSLPELSRSAPSTGAAGMTHPKPSTGPSSR